MFDCKLVSRSEIICAVMGVIGVRLYAVIDGLFFKEEFKGDMLISGLGFDEGRVISGLRFDEGRVIPGLGFVGYASTSINSRLIFLLP